MTYTVGSNQYEKHLQPGSDTGNKDLREEAEKYAMPDVDEEDYRRLVNCLEDAGYGVDEVDGNHIRVYHGTDGRLDYGTPVVDLRDGDDMEDNLMPFLREHPAADMDDPDDDVEQQFDAEAWAVAMIRSSKPGWRVYDKEQDPFGARSTAEILGYSGDEKSDFIQGYEAVRENKDYSDFGSDMPKAFNEGMDYAMIEDD